MSAPPTPADASRAFAAAINAGDVAAALDCWTADALMVAADGSRARGRDELRARFEALVAANLDLEIEVTDVIEAGEVALGRTSMTMTGPGTSLAFRARVVYLSDGAAWRIAIDQVEEQLRT